MRLTYIYHSGFAIEAENCNIIIDFFKDSETLRKGVVHDRLLKSDKKLYVLSTHSHTDHFNREILNWKEKKPDIQYVFSKEILEASSASECDAFYLDKLDVFSDNLITIQAFGSTDIGGSFLIKCEGKTIFHAGDLNNWHWNAESTAEEIKKAEIAYFKEVDLLAEHIQSLDLVMFPIDFRLGEDYTLGAQQFIDKVDVGVFVPMHFGKEYDKANAFEEYAMRKGCLFFKIIEKGDSVLF